MSLSICLTHTHTQSRFILPTIICDSHGFVLQLQLRYCSVCVSVDSLFFDYFFFLFHKLAHTLPAAAEGKSANSFVCLLHCICDATPQSHPGREYTHSDWDGYEICLVTYCLFTFFFFVILSFAQRVYSFSIATILSSSSP